MSITSAAGGGVAGAEGSRGLPSRGANVDVVSFRLNPRALAHSGHHDFTLLSVAANAFNVRAILPSDAVLRRYLGRWLGRVHSAYHPHDEVRTVDWIDGACLVVRREAYAQTGGFDEGIFLNGEDFDWCFRMRQAGWRGDAAKDALRASIPWWRASWPS